MSRGQFRISVVPRRLVILTVDTLVRLYDVPCTPSPTLNMDLPGPRSSVTQGITQVGGVEDLYPSFTILEVDATVLGTVVFEEFGVGTVLRDTSTDGEGRGVL